MERYLPMALNSWQNLFLVGLTLILIVVFRYILVCAVFEVLAYRLQLDVFFRRRTVESYPPARVRWQEFLWSMATCVIFAFSGLMIGVAWQQGYAKFYLDLDHFGFWYLPVSWLIYACIHDALYYWLHRAMHRPRLYRWMHRIHHASLKPSVWASFSFDPLESLAQAVILPLLILFIPIHPVIFIIHLTFMTLTAVSNHAGFELLPRGPLGFWISSWLISGTHHTQHHRFGRGNYGLFFTWWDRWGGTEHVKFQMERERLFRASHNGTDFSVNP